MPDGEFRRLLDLARSGDAEAVRLLYERHCAAVRARVESRLRGAVRRRHDCEDIVQTVFAEMLGGLARFTDRGEAAFRNWLLLKAMNEVRDARRRTLLRSGLRREITSSDTAREFIIRLGRGPATHAEMADERRRLRDVLARLAPQDADVVRLRGIEGLAFAEVASRLRLPGPDAARMRYGRALLEVRRLWDAR